MRDNRPSANGDNGRQGNGRFAKGNPGLLTVLPEPVKAGILAMVRAAGTAYSQEGNRHD